MPNVLLIIQLVVELHCSGYFMCELELD